MEHERFEGERTLMRIHIGESDKWHGKLLYQALVEFFRKEGLSALCCGALAATAQPAAIIPIKFSDSRKTCRWWSKSSKTPSAWSAFFPSSTK